MIKSKLPNAVLGKIWKLSDVDKDGMLDADEFALANYLINLKLEGKLQNFENCSIWFICVPFDRFHDKFIYRNFLSKNLLLFIGHELPAELPKHLVPPSKRSGEPIYPSIEWSLMYDNYLLSYGFKNLEFIGINAI